MPSRISASDIAKADLPLAVGPAIRTALYPVCSRSRLPSKVTLMSFVATLVSNPLKPAVDDDTLARVARVLGTSASPTVLAHGVAAEFTFNGFGEREAEAAIRETLEGKPVDIFVQPIDGRRKRLLIADMDSTMIRQECVDELAAELGIKDHIAAITERAMRGEIEFEPALRERVALLKGLSISAIETVLNTRIQLMPGGRTLVQTMKANGAYCALVSGGFTRFTNTVAAMIGFDESQANVLIEEDGKLTGFVQEPILGKDAKRQRLEELVEEKRLTFSETLAVGDGANDLAMIQRAGMGVAYRAKPAVGAAANMRVDHGDLTALLYLQGYSADEFVLS